MIKTSPIYQQLFKEGAIQEYRVNIDGVAYGHEIIKDSVSLQQNLLDKSTFTVGSFTISVLKLKLKLPSENIPHNANVVFSYRYNNGDVQSEWVEKFKGKITNRTKYTEEVTSIEAKDKASNYDKFLDFFGDVIDKYPANTRKVASLCSSHLGLAIENMDDVINLDIVEYPNELTMVEMLKNVARNSGGNWVIAGDKLRLVTTGKETNQTYPAQSIETSSLLSPISKILMYYADESAFESGDDTGSTLEIDSPWGTQSSADYVHGVLNGYEYVPIKVSGAYIDPAIELGDIVSIDGYDVLVANVKWVFDGIVTAEIEVPINNEINYDDPYNQLVQNQFKRKVSLGDSYQGVTISRDKGIEMLVSPDGTEENATGRYYADLYRGIAFQTRDNKNQEWHDWMYFDLDENMFKLSLYETKEITDGKFINLTNKYNNLVMTVDGLSSEIAQIQGGNIISNFVGELGVFDWSFEAEPLYPRNDLYPNNKLHPRDKNGAIMRVVDTDTAAGTGFELFAVGKAISQYAIVEGGADYSLYTRTKGANGVRFILREYSSADGSGSYQETVLATVVSSSNWTTLNHTLTIKQHTQSVRMVVEKTNYQETIFTNSSFNFGNPRPYTQSIADVNAKADYAKTLSEQTALEFTQTAQLVEQLDERVISSESNIIQNANEISTKVSKNKVISEINQSAETVGIKANKVELEGYTSINKHFKVLPNGDVEFTNATGNNMTITGNLTAGRIAGLNFNNSKITFPNGKLTLNSNTNSIDFGSGLQMEHSTFGTDLGTYDVAYFKSLSANTGVKIGVERGAGGRGNPFVVAQAIYGVTSQYPLVLNGTHGDIAYKGRILYIDSNGYVRAR